MFVIFVGHFLSSLSSHHRCHWSSLFIYFFFCLIHCASFTFVFIVISMVIFFNLLSWPKQIILKIVTVVFIPFVTTIVVIIIINGPHCNHCCPLSLWSLVISQPCYFSLNSHYFPPKKCLVYINITVLIITVLHHRIAGMTGTAACNWNNWKSRLEDGLAVV